MYAIRSYYGKGGDEPVRAVADLVRFGLDAAEDGCAGAEHVHGVARGGQLLEGILQSLGKSAKRGELIAIGIQFGGVGKRLVDEEMRNFLEGGMRREVPDRVAAIRRITSYNVCYTKLLRGDRPATP